MENKVDLKKVKGTGRDGRVLKEDVLKFLGQVREDYQPGITNIRSSPAFGARPAMKEYAPLTEDRVVPIRGYTRAMVKTMTDALKIPHFGYDDEASHNICLAMDTPGGLVVPNIKNCEQRFFCLVLFLSPFILWVTGTHHVCGGNHFNICSLHEVISFFFAAKCGKACHRYSRTPLLIFCAILMPVLVSFLLLQRNSYLQ
ncbi:unnamed protein product [Strongylus vulgaris]|uniref:Peripheral subunit-binding (PSBD) domain-containing protein n=1 Tax=Strongylus vulgaris TaxID=40348 RepID=A0A3P7IYP5_STRVU|nr:unnamed protein product [Strongylus vulgaris]